MKSDISSGKIIIDFPDIPKQTEEKRKVLSKNDLSFQSVPIGNNKISPQPESQDPCAEKIQLSVILCKRNN